MGDVVRHRVGDRTFSVFDLGGRASAISAAAFEMDGVIGDRLKAAEVAFG